MNCIKILKDEDFGLKSKEFYKPRIRIGARGIILNKKNEIAIIYKRKKQEYKLVGGGVEQQEEPMLAFEREALEETGCKIKIIKNLGTIEEHKSYDDFKQISFVYVAKVVEDTKTTHLTNQEKIEQAELLWCNLDDAISLIQNSENNLKPSPIDGPLSIYHSKFIVRRDLEILKYWKQHIDIEKNVTFI